MYQLTLNGAKSLALQPLGSSMWTNFFTGNCLFVLFTEIHSLATKSENLVASLPQVFSLKVEPWCMCLRKSVHSWLTEMLVECWPSQWLRYQLSADWDVDWVMIKGSNRHLTTYVCSEHDPKNLRITQCWKCTVLCTSLIINMFVLRFRVWTMKGKKKLYEFLADMG